MQRCLGKKLVNRPAPVSETGSLLVRKRGRGDRVTQEQEERCHREQTEQRAARVPLMRSGGSQVSTLYWLYSRAATRLFVFLKVAKPFEVCVCTCVCVSSGDYAAGGCRLYHAQPTACRITLMVICCLVTLTIGIKWWIKYDVVLFLQYFRNICSHPQDLYHADKLYNPTVACFKLLPPPPQL